MPDTDMPVTDRHADQLSLDAQLCFALYSAQLAMGKVYRHHLAGLGITYLQYLVLLILWETDGQTVNSLGARLGLDSATLTPLLKRMQALGLLERERAAADQRQVLITLTGKGRALRVEARAIPGRVLMATGLPRQRVQDLKAALESLRDNLAGSLDT